MASASAGSIFVDLLLRDASYVQGLNRARGTTRQFSGQVGRDVGRVQSAFAGVLSPVNNASAAIAQLGGVVAGAISVQQIIRYNDVWTQLSGRLSLVSDDMQNVGQVQQELFDIAQRTRQPLEGVYNLYTRLAQAIPAAQRSQVDLLGVTESINQALAITGEGSAQASSAILQFSQAVASGFKASSQEINSLLDSAPRLALALQRSFGDGSKSLKELSKDGELDLAVILKSLSGVGEEGQRLRDEFSKLPPTVGQAFTQLNNSFLQFIGQSKAVDEGANALVISIQFLANNLDLAAKAGIAIAAVMSSRVVGAFIATNAQAFAYQLTLARMAGISGVAATATLGLASALSTARLAFAAIGGPIGLAVIGTLGLLAIEQEQGAEAQRKLNEQMGAFEGEALKYGSASEELRNQIRQDTIDRIGQYEKELLAVQELFKAYEAQGLFGKFADNLGSSVRRRLGIGGGEGVRDIVAEGAALEASIQRLRELQEDYDNLDSRPGFNPTGEDSEEGNKKLKEINALYEKYEYLIRGVTQAQIDYQREEAEIGRLFSENKISLDEYFTALEGLDTKYDEIAEKANKTGVDLEQFGKRAAENIQDSFADFLFDPFADGLQGMAKGFVDTIRKMIAEAQAAQLAKYLFGELAGGEKGASGILGGLFGGGSSAQSSGFLGGLFDGFFADGGNIQPGHFGIAGEAGAELIYGGNSGATVIPQNKMKGGNTYNIDARGADQGAVRRIEQALLALAGPGVTESRIGSAQARGEL